MLSGPRQAEKTTLLLQTIDQLIKSGVPPSNIICNFWPFLEIKYQSQLTTLDNIQESIQYGYVLTKTSQDIGLLENKFPSKIMRIPSALFCYWLGESEILRKSILIPNQ